MGYFAGGAQGSSRRPDDSVLPPSSNALGIVKLSRQRRLFHPLRAIDLFTSSLLLLFSFSPVRVVLGFVYQRSSVSYHAPRLSPLPLLTSPHCHIMADDTPAADESVTFTVKSSNDAKYTFTLPTSTLVSELKNKLSSSEYADTPADRQRLIYSGRVLKDNEALATYKIKDGHTVHLVKSAASNQRQAAQTSASAPGTTSSQGVPGVPTNIAAGTGNNPLAGLTGARYAGFAQLPGAGMFGPDGGVSRSGTAQRRWIAFCVY